MDDGGGEGGMVMIKVPDDRGVSGSTNQEACGVVHNEKGKNVEDGGGVECDMNKKNLVCNTL